MFFGEFLVNKGAISKDALIDALVFQVKNMPSFLDALVEENILSKSEIYDLVLYQIKENLDLVAAISQKKLLSEEEIKTVLEKQTSKRRPLGEILVERGVLTSNRINELIEEYHNQAPVVEEKSKEEEAKPAISQAAIESLKELGQYDPALFEDYKEEDSSNKEEPQDKVESEVSFSDKIEPEYLDAFLLCFNEGEKEQAIATIGKWKFDNDYDSHYSAINNLTILLSNSLVLLEAKLGSDIVNKIEAVLKLISDKSAELPKRFFMIIQDAFNLLWDYRTSLEKTCSEKTLIEDEVWFKGYTKLTDDIKKLEEKMK